MEFMRYVTQRDLPLWEACLEQPFLVELQQGTLEQAVFREYMIESTVYLHNYARVFAVGLTKTRTTQALRRFSDMIASISQGTYTQRHLQRLGVTGEQLDARSPHAITRQYMEHQMRAAQQQDLAGLMMAVMPCMLLYSYLAERLYQNLPAVEHHPYADWLADFAGDTYRQDGLAWARFAEDCCAPADASRKRQLADIFTRSSQYELAFWEVPYALV